MRGLAPTWVTRYLALSLSKVRIPRLCGDDTQVSISLLAISTDFTLIHQHRWTGIILSHAISTMWAILRVFWLLWGHEVYSFQILVVLLDLFVEHGIMHVV